MTHHRHSDEPARRGVPERQGGGASADDAVGEEVTVGKAAVADRPDGLDDEARTPLGAIGAGLRRLRMQRGLRQYEAAEAAGVTKAMLSAYETGKRRPSLKTLDSLLTAMGADLGDLHRALVAHRREIDYLSGGAAVPRRWEIGETPSSYGGREASPPYRLAGGARPDVYGLLGITDPLPADEEQALGEMLHGFLKLLRFMHHRFAVAAAGGGGRGAAGGRFSGGPFDG